MSNQPEFLTRKQAAEYLLSLGINLSHWTLARYAWTDKGPKYSIIGKQAFYRHCDIDAWVQSQVND